MKSIYILCLSIAIALGKCQADDLELLPAHPTSPTISLKANHANSAKDALVNFEQALQAYVTEQKELQTQLKDPSQNERAKIREALDKNKESITAKREEFKSAIKRLHFDNPKLNVKDDQGARPGGKARH